MSIFIFLIRLLIFLYKIKKILKKKKKLHYHNTKEKVMKCKAHNIELIIVFKNNQLHMKCPICEKKKQLLLLKLRADKYEDAIFSYCNKKTPNSVNC